MRQEAEDKFSEEVNRIRQEMSAAHDQELQRIREEMSAAAEASQHAQVEKTP